jgi:hypothetical protein
LCIRKGFLQLQVIFAKLGESSSSPPIPSFSCSNPQPDFTYLKLTRRKKNLWVHIHIQITLDDAFSLTAFLLWSQQHGKEDDRKEESLFELSIEPDKVK